MKSKFIVNSKCSVRFHAKLKMNDLKVNQFPFFTQREINLVQLQHSNELIANLNKLINAEVIKNSTKMTHWTMNFFNSKLSNWKQYSEELQQKLKQAESLINQLKAENEKLQIQLGKCSTRIENQHKKIVEQENAIDKKTKELESLKIVHATTVRSHGECAESLEKTSKDLAESKKQNDYLTSEISKQSNILIDKIEDYEARLVDQGKMADNYFSSYLSEFKENDALKVKLKQQENLHTSQLFDLTKQNDKLKTELFQATSKMEKLKREIEVKSANNDNKILMTSPEKEEFELILKEKDSQIQEYLKIINQKDDKIQLQKPCCPVCMTDVEEEKQWIAFYKCGHRTCSECYDDLQLTPQNTKLCPICQTVVSVSVVLADT